MMRITHVSLLVHDQREAQEWYTEKLGWRTIADEPFPGDPHNRWITVGPEGQEGLEVVLELPHWGVAPGEESRVALVGKTPGFIIATDDCQAEYERLSANGVRFIGPPEELPWGISAMFFDLYGTAQNLLQPGG
ncbi:MAG: VOC family protein [Chloroflexaceae bacterium]